jgi:hypothetical protein
MLSNCWAFLSNQRARRARGALSITLCNSTKELFCGIDDASVTLGISGAHLP